MSEWTKRQGSENCWERRVGGVLLVVHHHVHFPKDQWLMSVHFPHVANIELKPKDIEQAKCQASNKLQVMLEEAIKDITEVQP